MVKSEKPTKGKIDTSYFGHKYKYDYSTQPELYEVLDREFNFTLDAAASHWNAKCDNYFTAKDNALKKVWRGNVFLNPPYGRETEVFVKKSYLQFKKGNTNVVVLLLAARTDTNWYHKYCSKGEVRFLKGRVKHGNRKGEYHSGPFASMIVIFGKGRRGKFRNWDWRLEI